MWWSKRRPSEEDRYGALDFLYHEDTLETPPLDEVYRVRVGDSQTLLMWRDRERTPEGYKRMVIRDEFFRADMAILAVLTIMEADRAELKTPWKYAGNEPELDFAEALLRYYRDDFDSLKPDVDRVFHLLRTTSPQRSLPQYDLSGCSRRSRITGRMRKWCQGRSGRP